jgi:hypothetical protein
MPNQAKLSILKAKSGFPGGKNGLLRRFRVAFGLRPGSMLCAFVYR